MTGGLAVREPAPEATASTRRSNRPSNSITLPDGLGTEGAVRFPAIGHENWIPLRVHRGTLAQANDVVAAC